MIETGSFIREVSSFGQGPNEYTGSIFDSYGFDEKNDIIFTGDSHYESCKGINLETNNVELIVKKPLIENANERIHTSAPWLIKDDTYISFCNNRTGKDKIKLIVYDKEGSIMKQYPNYLEFHKGESRTNQVSPGIFYYYKGLTYFKEMFYNDTVFSVDENNLAPHIIFKLGNKQPSYYHRMANDNTKGKYLINFVNESNSFVLFNFIYYTETETMRGPMGSESIAKDRLTHTGYFDKKTKQVYISSSPDYQKSGYILTGLPVGFLPISINKNKEMIAHIDPEELIKYKEKIDPQYKHLLQNIQEDDNPIVVIAKIKE